MADTPIRDDTELEAEIIRLANIYAAKRGWSAVIGIDFMTHRKVKRWATENEGGSIDSFLLGDPGAVTLTDALAWLREQVSETH